MSEEKFTEMSLIDHLTELRKRLLWSFFYILIVFIVCFYFADELFSFLASPLVQLLDTEKGQGFIEFRDPLEYHKSGFPYDAEANIWKPIECTTNDVLIFPGWLNHRTQENTVGGERICMTYNINARMKMDDVKGKFRL